MTARLRRFVNPDIGLALIWAMTLGFFLVLLAPGDTTKKNPVAWRTTVDLLGDEHHIMLCAGLAFFAQTTVMLARSQRLRTIGAMTSSFWWSVLAFEFLRSNAISTATAFFVPLAVANLAIVLLVRAGRIR